MNASIGDGMAALGLAGGIFGYLFLKYRIRQRQIDIIHHERMAAMEKGITLPELTLEEPRPDQTVVPILGMILLTLSLGAMIVLYMNLPATPHGFWVSRLPFYVVLQTPSHGLWASPLPFTFMGLGLIAYHFSQVRPRRQQ